MPDMPQHTHNADDTEFKGLADWIEIFKSGEQTDSRGRKQTFTHADLDQIVANTGAANPIPHRITHKSLFSPFAYAQGVEAKREGDSLYIKSDKIEPQFEKLIKDGRLYERSVGIRKSDKGWKLDHIAWLGAEPPAVDGLAPVEFESGDDVYEFTLSDHPDARWAFDILARNLRNIRDWMIDKFDLETADRVVPDYHVDAVKRASEIPSDPGNKPEFSSMYAHPQQFMTATPQNGPLSGSHRTENHATVTHETTKKTGGSNVNEEVKTFSQADLDAALEQEKQQRKLAEKTLNDERQKNRLAEFQSSVSQQVDAGKLTPAQADGMAEFMLSLAESDTQFEFSRGEGDQAESITESRDKWFSRFVESLTPHKLGETSGAGDQEIEHKYQMPHGESADEEEVVLFQKAKQYQSDHDVPFMVAYRAVGGQ